jgi:mono/diheme cytochrome c family protein
MIRRAPRLLLLFVTAALGVAACANHEERGRQLYAERGCAVCHGTGGRGDGPSAKRLDAPPRDLADVSAYRQGASQDEISSSIRRGAGAMPAFRDISESEANDMAAWIVSLQRRPGGSGSQP